MSINTNYKIRKSKLIYCIPINRNKSQYQDLDARQKHVCQLTQSSSRHSHYKFQTINYKKYDIQRRIKLDKRKHSEKPLSLFLDGNTPAIITDQNQKKRRNTFKTKIYFQSTADSTHQPERQAFLYEQKRSTRNTLKNIILREIQSKHYDKGQKDKNLAINNFSFQAVEQLFVLKKMNKLVRQKRSDRRVNQMQLSSLQQFAVNQNSKIDLRKSVKYPLFSERSYKKSKNKIPANTQRQLSVSLLPVVEQKSQFRPLVTLQQKQTKRIQSQSYIVLKYPQNKVVSGLVYKKNAEIASLTKIMTFYTILNICQYYSIDYKTKNVEVCQTAEEMSGTSAELFEGQKYTLEQLFYGLMLPSGNDAAVAIANFGGSVLKQCRNKNINPEQQNVKCFVKYMNIKAKDIGMKSSTFMNPHGLPNPHSCSNPYEIALLISFCLKFQQFIQVTGTKRYSFWISNQKAKRQIIWQNTHKLLRRQGFIGGKTGVTITAGPCLATVYKSKSNQIFITVLLRARKLSRRFKQTRLILGLSLKKLDSKLYEKQVKQILKSNAQLDSDNSSDQQTFDFTKSDSVQMEKRNKILVYSM